MSNVEVYIQGYAQDCHQLISVSPLIRVGYDFVRFCAD